MGVLTLSGILLFKHLIAPDTNIATLRSLFLVFLMPDDMPQQFPEGNSSQRTYTPENSTHE